MTGRIEAWLGALALSLMAAVAPALAQSGGANGAPSPLPQTSTQIFPGTGQFTGNARRHATVDAKGDITLNFVNADVKDVAKAILGDYLKLNYEIASNVQGTVTIQTSQPLSRDQVIPALDRALRLNNMALVNNDGIYDVVPLADAQHETGAIKGPGGGVSMEYGSEVVPLRYVSAVQMQKLLEPLAPAQGIVHADASRNLLIIDGTAEQRKTLREDIALFDTDWLAGMSFALYTPTYMDADELARELDQVMGSSDSPIAGVVKLMPIDRLNAVLAISPQKKYLAKLQAWVDRLDRPGEGSDRKIFVYHVQNGRASDLASTLAKVLFGGSTAQGGNPGLVHTTPYGTPAAAAAPASASSTTASVGGGISTQMASGSESGIQSSSPEGYSASGSLHGEHGNPVSITADEVNNALVIYATPREYATIDHALHQLDTQPVQVFLEAVVAEVTLNNSLKFGLQYFYQPDSKNTFTLSNTSTSTLGQAFPGFSYMFSNGSNIQVVLNALENITHVEVISSPKILVLNNLTATLQVGDQVPVETAQSVSTSDANAPIVNSISYADTGVILKVTPRVNRGGVVMMDISQEVSAVDPTISTEGVNSPAIQQRKIDSSIAIQDGQTVALGGLITDERSKGKSGIPLLQDIPIVGNLFTNANTTHDRTELIVLITPHVVDSSLKAQAITDELRRKLPSVEAILSQDGN
ncbi:MAG TPA: type II secretion system secretin GspD [Rhizomicrobium sp.]|nr:type II secretion system secretin GspD [Rhizomicrobium sp.]